MTPEEQKRADAAAKKRAYRQRKRSESLARQDIHPTDSSNLHELEQQFKDASMREPQPIIPSNREHAQAIVSDAEERHRRVDFIMANHNRIRSNPSELMWEILKLLNLMRIEMVDLLGGKK